MNWWGRNRLRWLSKPAARSHRRDMGASSVWCSESSKSDRTSLTHNLPDHLPAELAQLPVPARVEVSQLGIVQPHQRQDRDVHIPHRMRHVYSLLADLVGRADDV